MSVSPGGKPPSLSWDVYVKPAIPTVTGDKPAGVNETFFQAIASTLIYGVRDGVLVDAFLTVEQATALADWVGAKKMCSSMEWHRDVRHL